MNKIVIGYWHLRDLPGLPYKHQDELPFSNDNLLNIIMIVLNAGYNSMIQRVDNNEVFVWIDKGRFGQS